MMGRSWKTTLLGAIQAGLMAAWQIYEATQGKDVNWPVMGLSVALAIVGWLAKDAGVTGAAK